MNLITVLYCVFCTSGNCNKMCYFYNRLRFFCKFFTLVFPSSFQLYTTVILIVVAAINIGFTVHVTLLGKFMLQSTFT